MKKNYIYSDVDNGLRMDDKGNVIIRYDGEAITQSLRTLFASVNGEFVRSNRGSTLIRLLGRTMGQTTANLISTQLKDMIRNYEPRATLTNISVIPETDRGLYNVVITLVINETGEQFRINERLRSMEL